MDLVVGTDGGISVAGQANRPIISLASATLIALFGGIAVTAGKHAGCYTALDRAVHDRQTVDLQPVRVDGAAAAGRRRRATACGRCTQAWVIGLEVEARVKASLIERYECTLCGECGDTCPKKAIRYSFSVGCRMRSCSGAG